MQFSLRHANKDITMMSMTNIFWKWVPLQVHGGYVKFKGPQKKVKVMFVLTLCPLCFRTSAGCSVRTVYKLFWTQNTVKNHANCMNRLFD